MAQESSIRFLIPNPRFVMEKLFDDKQSASELGLRGIKKTHKLDEETSQALYNRILKVVEEVLRRTYVPYNSSPREEWVVDSPERCFEILRKDHDHSLCFIFRTFITNRELSESESANDLRKIIPHIVCSSLCLSSHIGYVPPEIMMLHGLERLSLSGMGLHVLPGEIGNAMALKELDISENLLEELPSQLKCLSELSQLSIQHNPITTFPPVIALIEHSFALRIDEKQNSSFTDCWHTLSNETRLQIIK